MATNKRQLIITALDTKLKTILTTGGYETNAGNNIYEWHPYATPATQMTSIVYRDTRDEVDTNNERDQHIHKLTVELYGYTYGTTAFTDARKLIADINKAIDADRKFGGYVDDVVLTEQVIDADMNDRLTAVVLMRIELWYLTGEFDGYGL